MLEVQVIGNYYICHELEAKILPERLLLSDLIEADSQTFEVISEKDFEAFMSHNLKFRIQKDLGV